MPHPTTSCAAAGVLIASVMLGCSENTPDYNAQAREQINADNMEQELQALEQQINAPDPDLP